MMRFIINRFFYLLLCLPLLSMAANQTFQLGKDYKLVTNPLAVELNSNKIEVREFFSYGCPACYTVEPAVQTWLANHPKDVAFKRVPVIFQRSWETYAKAYYIAEAFGVEAKITPMLFDAIQNQNLNLSNGQSLVKFFTEAGVKADDFQSAFDSSPAILLKLKQDDEIMKRYRIIEIPTFIINNRYYTTAAMAKNAERLIHIIDFLIAKAKAD